MKTKTTTTSSGMKHTKKACSLAAALIILGSLAGGANAAIVISDWNITTTTLSFNVYGEIETGSTFGSNYQDELVIGEPLTGGWVNTPISGAFATDNGGSSVTVSSVYAATNGSPSGNRVFLIRGGGSWQVGDALDFSVNITGGSFTPSAIDPNNIIASVGYTNVGPPEVTHQVGAFAVVPEPTSTFLLGIGGLGLLFRRHR